MSNRPSLPAVLTGDLIARMAGAGINDNIVSTYIGLQMAGVGAGLTRRHRLAHFLAQLSHESMGWRYDREIWGPTAAQTRYEGRKDLGNTQPGDGKRFMGRGPIQITGRANYQAFAEWARGLGARTPDFEANPDAVLSDPWEGLGPIWYWEAGNPDRASLNRYADAHNIVMVTRRINGGLNGYADRVNRYTRCALVLAGYGPTDVRRFQADHRLKVDGIDGPATRATLHRVLSSAPVIHLTHPATAPAAPSDGLLASIIDFFKRIFGG